ncbi:MAG: efflux RND transporter periplasmic adaptor subunit [Polyangiales bacterium]
MKKRYLGVVGGVIAGLAFGIGVGSSGAGGTTTAPSVAKAKVATPDPRGVALSSELAERARLKIEPVTEQQLSPTVRLVGSVNFNPNQVAEIGARIEGRVTRIMVSVGDSVKKGQALAEIESNVLGEAFASLLSARANLIAAEHNEARESGLASQQLSSAPIVERARAEVKALRAEVRGAEQRLLAMGFGADEIEQLKAGKGPNHITLRAPLDGEVVDRFAVLGQVVNSTTPVLRIAHLDSVWVELDVFERDLPRVTEGNAARISSEMHPEEVFEGRVAHVDSTIDMATRTAHVRVEVDNTARLLRPGQFVTARLSTSGEQRNVLVVPRSAVLQVEGEPSVFVSLGNDKFVARPVELGQEAHNRVEIERGLLEGDLVVTEGGFVLKSELLR